MQTTTQLPDGVSLEALGALFAIGEATLHRGAPVPRDSVHFVLRVGKFKAGKLIAVLCEAGMLQADKTHLYHPRALAEIEHRNAIKKQRSLAGKASHAARYPNKKVGRKKPVVSEASSNKIGKPTQRALETPLNPKPEATLEATFDEKPIKTKKTPPTVVAEPVSRGRTCAPAHPFTPSNPTNIHSGDSASPELFANLPTSRHASKEKPTDEEILDANDLWNEYARPNPNWRVTVGTPTKRRSADIAALLIRARQVHGGLRAVLDRASEPQVWFLNHHDEFRFSLDFLCQSRTKRDDRPVIIQIMEGYYDGRHGETTGSGQSGEKRFDNNGRERSAGGGNYQSRKQSRDQYEGSSPIFKAGHRNHQQFTSQQGGSNESEG